MGTNKISNESGHLHQAISEQDVQEVRRLLALGYA